MADLDRGHTLIEVVLVAAVSMLITLAVIPLFQFLSKHATVERDPSFIELIGARLHPTLREDLRRTLGWSKWSFEPFSDQALVIDTVDDERIIYRALDPGVSRTTFRRGPTDWELTSQRNFVGPYHASFAAYQADGYRQPVLRLTVSPVASATALWIDYEPRHWLP